MEEAKSEEDFIAAMTDSFWDIGNYKRVVKRVDDGAKLCVEYGKMINERAEIEAKYAKRLQEWAKKMGRHDSKEFRIWFAGNRLEGATERSPAGG